ncbi:amidohydrolase family protein [Roseisalinus antarcticus]|uniref:Amidohydrolase n=1 Tax=Roseisalinus antarcticus TaxID=254357 RepID=A0A1Y5U2T4_9RHOB|nr:amidohydrolase family protein [Roseisalinus antarcticus]SLN77489.1 Amidohydrolase [Roseisalinus antarcticus]
MTQQHQIKAIDAHHHVWDPARGDYSWMTPAHDPIARVFTTDDLAPELATASVSHSVLVQTWSSVAETETFLRIAERVPFVAGIVGWIDMTSPDSGEALDRLLALPEGRHLKGIRHQVHDEDDPDWLRRDDVMRSLAEIDRRGLSYDLLIRPREIPAALEVSRTFPTLRLILDHIAKPDIASGAMTPWANQMEAFALHRDHVWCKISGLVTEDDWTSRDDERLVPYVETVLSIFGTDRVMYGSDWPVCLLAGGYGRTLALLRRMIETWPEDVATAILRGNASDAYDLRLD